MKHQLWKSDPIGEIEPLIPDWMHFKRFKQIFDIGIIAFLL